MSRAALFAALLLSSAAARAQGPGAVGGAFRALDPCRDLDRTACAAWVGGAHGVPLALALGGSAVTEVGREGGAFDRTALGAGLAMMGAGFVVGPAAGSVAAGHGRAALPGLALRAAATAATAALMVRTARGVDGLGGGVVVGLVAVPGLTVVALSSGVDARALRRRLRADTARRQTEGRPSRPVELSLAPGGARLSVPL